MLYVLLLIFVGVAALWPSVQTTASPATEDANQEKALVGCNFPQPEADRKQEKLHSETNYGLELGEPDSSGIERDNSAALKGPDTSR